MDRLQHVIEEAKLRTVWWLVCIFIVTYFLTHTSKSMWMNIPIAIAIISGLHIFVTVVEFHWKTRKPNQQSYLSHLERKQLSVNDSRLSTLPPQSKWKRKIDSPVVETAMEDFVNKILQEFVLDLWYANITPDKEAPQLIHSIIMDIFAEISIRVKDINLVDLLTRDLVDLVGDHLELFRKNQAAIGIEVMVTLSSEERDERLKHHLMASNDLHPALISSESEYKFLKRIMGAVLAAVLRTREAQCPLVRCIVRELLTCLVMQPVMRFASPGFINELIAGLLLANDKKRNEAGDDDQSTNITGQNQNHEKSQDLDAMKRDSSSSQKNNTFNDQNGTGLNLNPHGLIISGPGQDGPLNPQSFAWARGLEAKTQRRTEVLQPENLENMWTKGRNYKRKSQKQKFLAGINENNQQQNLDGRILSDQSKISNSSDLIDGNISDVSDQNQVGGPIISEFYSANVGGDNDVNINNTGSDKVARTEGQVPKIRCRVLGAYFENISSKSFAVYSIAVTDADNKTWQVKRRYRNFERLHRHLKAIPNYTLQLPPKRIFSSSTEDAFVHQRCIQLDKYLQDLLSIANIAEQHEVWDFLSMTSKRYCFGRSSSVVRKLAVNVDEAVDDMVRQIKGVSGGLKKKAVGSGFESSASFANRNVSFKADELTDSGTKLTTSNSFAQNKGGGPAANVPSTSGLKEDPFGVPAEVLAKNTTDDINGMPYEPYDLIQSHVPYITQKKWSYEWTPTNVSVPLLNLVDNIFQLNRRGWLRRQVFWISKQILQLMMEDAIDDCLLRQIHFLRSDTLVAQGIHWVQNILWPGGTFFLKLRQSQPESSQSNESSCKAPSAAGKNNKGAFEEQLEAARRANDIKNMILDGSPTTLVSLIGQKQYRQSAIDIYYFSQSAVCLKQLGYGLLELIVITVFPELRDIISDAHEKKNDPTV